MLIGAPAWLRRRLGDKPSSNVNGIDFRNKKEADKLKESTTKGLHFTLQHGFLSHDNLMLTSCVHSQRRNERLNPSKEATNSARKSEKK